MRINVALLDSLQRTRPLILAAPVINYICIEFMENKLKFSMVVEDLSIYKMNSKNNLRGMLVFKQFAKGLHCFDNMKTTYLRCV